MLRIFTVFALLLCFAGQGLAQQQPTVMDMIREAQANNQALSARIAETSAKVDALGAALNAQAAQIASMQAKLDKIHVAIVANPQLVAVPAPPVAVAPAGRSIAMAGPAGMMAMESHGGMGMAGACSSGSCGSGRGRMVARMRMR